jgi:hypothetical protein
MQLRFGSNQPFTPKLYLKLIKLLNVFLHGIVF